MMFTPFEYVIVGVYLLFILGIGMWFSRKGSESVEAYFLGNNGLPWWVLGISFMTSNLDLTGTMVIASFFSIVGVKGFLIELRGGTCLPLALFLIFMAKWHRRAGVMTMAEWMEFRFGNDLGARAARLVCAIGVVILVLGMMTYFCVGFGKFLSLYFPFSPTVCATVFTTIACAHILTSGLYGVAFTDVIQGVMILGTVVALAWLGIAQGVDLEKIGAAWSALGVEGMTWASWTDMSPSWTMDFPAGYEAYNAFGFLLVFWVMRIFLEGFGGPLVPYASQRFFAAKDERDASLTTAISLVLFVIRWPLIMAVALLGLSLGADIPQDPEMVFPAVLGTYFPVGVRAVVVSCMIAAAMSTFDSTVNAGGAYIVNDIYRRYINPKASTRALMRLSWASTVGLTVACLLLASTLSSINEIWSWLSMGLFGGMAVPMVLRWYWERLNGWGYTVGTVVGIGAAIVQKAVAPGLSEWAQLALMGSLAATACVIGALATAPTARETVVAFYRKTRPMGHWPRARSGMAEDEVADIDAETRRDLVAIAPAMAFFFFLFVAPMYLVIREWGMMVAASSLAALAGAGMYFTWYRHLPPPATEGQSSNPAQPSKPTWE